MTKHKNTVHLKNLGTPRRSSVPSATTPKAKIATRNRIQDQIEEFLANGGTIQRSDLQDRTRKVMSRYGASFNKSGSL